MNTADQKRAAIVAAVMDEVLDQTGRSDQPSAADVRHEEPTVIPVLPNMALHGMAGRFVDALRNSTEAPPEFLLAAFLTIVAALIGRRAWVSYSRPTYPNLYSLLVGETAGSRKTTAMGFAVDLMADVSSRTGSKLKPFYGLASVEGLADAMKGERESPEPYRIVAVEDEFKSLMKKAQQKGVSNLIPRLTELYNCGRRFEVNTRNNRVSIENPFFCLVSASTPAWFSESMGDSEISGGFFNRWSMFSSKATRLIPFPVAPDQGTWKALVDELVEIVQYADGQCQFAPEARAIFTDFYRLFRKRSETGLRAEATARADVHAIKYALLYAILELHQQIEAEDIARGIALANYNLEVALSVVSDAGLSWSGTREKKVLSLLKSGSEKYAGRHACTASLRR